MKNKVLVTGGAGFVGSNLVRQLLEADYAVTVLDNLCRGKAENLPTSDDLTVMIGDICNAEDVAAACETKPGAIIHLAAHHYIPYCNEHPAETVRVNVFGTQMILDAAAKTSSVGKMIFASTAAVYGPSDYPHTESEQLAPIDIYGFSKMHAEDLMAFFHRNTGIPTLNARLFNVVGPRETNPHLLPDIVDQLPPTGPIQLGNLVPKRDYIHADDIGTGIMTLLESDVAYDSVNIGTGKAYSPKDLVDYIGDAIGVPVTIDSVPERQRSGDRPMLCADNSKLSSLGWKCDNDIRQSLEKVLSFEGIID